MSLRINPVSSAIQIISSGIPTAVSHACKAVSDTGALKRIMQIVQQTLKGWGHIICRGHPFPIETVFGKGVSVINAFECIPDSYDLANTPLKKKNGWKIAALAGSLIADLGNVILLLDEVEILKFSRIAASFGAVETAQELPKLIFGNGVAIAAGAASVCFAIDALKKLRKAPDVEIKRQYLLELCWHVSKVALSAFIVVASIALTKAGSLAVWGSIALGIVAAGLGLAQFFHKQKLEVL